MLTRELLDEMRRVLLETLGRDDALFVATQMSRHTERFMMQANAVTPGGSVIDADLARAWLAIAKRLDSEGSALS